MSLQQVIGTTCSSVNAFGFHAGTSSFVYTAGAAAVLASVDKDLGVTQRFFRGHASQYAITKPAPPSTSLHSSSAPSDLRSRLAYRSSREDSPFSPGSHDVADSPSGSSKGGHARDRVKAATAVSLSNNGRWLAVGETGYRPRVLLFAVTEKTSSDTPAAIISEHSFGVQAVAFSSDKRLLATLGTVNDGFLYIWEIDDKTGAVILLASNKCTNVVRHMAWMGRTLVTVGVRFVKIWRPDEQSAVSTIPGDQTSVLSGPSHKPLAGRNSLLHGLLDETFIIVATTSDSSAFICTESGHVCLIDDSDRQQHLSQVALVKEGITAAVSTPSGDLLVASSSGDMRLIPADELKRSATPATLNEPASPRSARVAASTSPLAIGLLPFAIVTVDNSHRIQLRSPLNERRETPSFSIVKTLSAHSDPVLGVRSLISADDKARGFLTWSADGAIFGWTSTGQPAFTIQVPLEQVRDVYDVTNELRTVSIIFCGSLLVTGDKYGVLR